MPQIDAESLNALLIRNEDKARYIKVGANLVRANEYQKQLKLAKQIEKLSWMVEYLANGNEDVVEDAELDWHEEQLYRDALAERREAGDEL